MAAQPKHTREDALRALGLKADPGGLTEALLLATLTRPVPRRLWLSDSGGRGHVPGLGVRVTAARPGPKGTPAPGTAAFYVQGRVGRSGALKQVWIGRVGVTELAEARTRAREVLNKLHRGENPTAERAAARAEERRRVTGAAYVTGDLWERHLKNRKSGKAERQKLLGTWGDLLRKRLDEVTFEDINARLQERRDAGTAANTVLRDWTAFRSMLHRAKEDGVLAALPVDRTLPAIDGLQGRKRVRWLGMRDPAEVRRFEGAIAEESAEIQAALTLLALTGMRRGELLGLRKSEVRLRDGVAVIPPERSKSGRERIVRLNPAAQKVLKGFKVTDLSGAYFPGSEDTWKTRLRRAMERIRTAAKLEDFKANDLRHHFAVKLRQSGAALEIVRDALGHADLRSTQVYAHVAETELRDAVAKVKL